MSALDKLKRYAAAHRLETYNVVDGLGVRFSDGFDVYWFMPEERWYHRNYDPTSDLTKYFATLDEQRQQAIDAIRSYLATLDIVINALPNGYWSLEDSGGVVFNLHVGILLTETLARGPNLAFAVEEVFKGSAVKSPSARQIQQHLSEYGVPFRETVATEEPDEADATPLAVLQFMRSCKSLQERFRSRSGKAITNTAKPKGRIWRTLLQFADRLPHSSACLELLDGSMHVDFDDKFDSYVIAPKSIELRKLVRSLGSEQAGNHLADEFEQLNSARQQVLNAVFAVLRRHGFYLDSFEEKYVGRELREFPLDLGENLTAVISKSGEEAAIGHILGQHAELAQEAIEILGSAHEVVTLDTRPLRRAVPQAVELPPLTEAQLSEYDDRSRLVLGKFMKSDAALSAFFDRLMWDTAIDTWAQASQWQKLAQKHVGGKHPRPDVEYILMSFGDEIYKSRFRERLTDIEPHFESPDQDIEMMWHLRNELPELAAKWFGPSPYYEDIPFAKVRARLGDPIAGRYLLDDWDDEDEITPPALANIPQSVVERIVEPKQLKSWREAASRWAIEEWQWERGGDLDMLSAAANMGWQEMADHLAANPYILPGLSKPSEGEPGILYASGLFLAWSKLKPSAFLLKFIGFAMNMDRKRLMKDFSEQCVGISVENVLRSWSNQLDIALAIAWHRCREHVPSNNV
ncbi:hypothetical protein CA54_15020 [Symmachiella macrocystis]|uniref:Uncharacterized protein n=1 Tax=Symmachiella macrocystis TaxID=2527985 RepID=A0A5C6BKQ7_9PLAN|nr:hypothetical protein [Symmachiella macrocystis]TWU12678.1 hypothetical protein CA54_15020 [Symmachiella macrocystis]